MKISHGVQRHYTWQEKKAMVKLNGSDASLVSCRFMDKGNRRILLESIVSPVLTKHLI